MTATTSSEEGAVETVQPPIRAPRRWDFRVVLIAVAFVPFVLALPYLWPRVLDPAVPAPRLEHRDDIVATLAGATALRTAYATVARHERNYRVGSTAMAVVSGVGAGASWLFAAGPGMILGSAVLGGIAYGGQLVFYSDRTATAYERGEHALGCIDEAAHGLRDVAPARFTADAQRLEAVLTQGPQRARPVVAELGQARAAVVAALRSDGTREVEVAAIDRYEATRTVDPTPLARSLRDDTRALDEARRRLATLKPAAAAHWRKELNQLAGLSARVTQLRQRADDLARAEGAAFAARALARAEHAAAQGAIDATAPLVDGAAAPLAAASALAAALAAQRDGLAALARELAGAVDAVHAAVTEDIAKPAPTRDALRQAIARLEAVTGARLDALPPGVAAPGAMSIATPVAPTAMSVSPPVPTTPAAVGGVDPLEPADAPALIAASLERAQAAVTAHGAALAGAAATIATLDRAAAALKSGAAASAQAHERLAVSAMRLGPDVANLVQAAAAATTLVRSVDVTGTRTKLAACLQTAASGVD
ncbi:MAG: hypothetical protein JO021_18945 [Alphaproteobacteria bacterium]|nr:hypothetical protein [Alphaproteobacteria bacterium]